MWPLPPLRDDVISLVIKSPYMHCAWLNRNSKNAVHMSAFASYELEHAAYITIEHNLKQFIEDHNLAHSFLSVALTPPFIHEEFFTCRYIIKKICDRNIGTIIAGNRLLMSRLQIFK